MKAHEEKPDRNCTHLAAEYFVAAELCKRKYSVGITMGKAKAIDIIAEKGAKTANVQVKGICSRKQVGWPMMKDKVVSNVIYVLVSVNDLGKAPIYFVLTSRETKAKIKQYAIRGIINYRKVNDSKYRERWDKIEKALR